MFLFGLSFLLQPGVLRSLLLEVYLCIGSIRELGRNAEFQGPSLEILNQHLNLTRSSGDSNEHPSLRNTDLEDLYPQITKKENFNLFFMKLSQILN